MGIEQDYDKAYQLYKQAADEGYADGYCGMAELQMDGNGVVQDEMAAFAGFQMALDAQDIMWRNHAKCMIAKLYMADYAGIGLDYNVAYDWFMQAASEGYGPGFLEIGNMYYLGNGVEKNLPEALRWFEMAAGHGNIAGMYSAAFMLEHGQGTEIDYAKALEYYLQAANLGDADSMYALGVMYESGHGTPEDYAQARYWLELATHYTDDIELLEAIGEELAYVASGFAE